MDTNTILAVAAASQAIFTIAIVMITARYVRLTRKLLEIQIHPEVEIEIPNDILSEPNVTGQICNYGGCNVLDLQVRTSIPFGKPKDKNGLIMQCTDVQSWPNGLKQREKAIFNCRELFRHAEESYKIPGLSSEAQELHTTVFFDVSCRREADKRPFYFTEAYRVKLEEDGTMPVIRTYSGVSTTNARKILRAKVVNDKDLDKYPGWYHCEKLD
jgi:hypothetical protein